MEPDQVSPEDLIVRENPQEFTAMEKCLIELAQTLFKSVVIETSNFTTEQVVSEVVRHLRTKGMDEWPLTSTAIPL